MRKAIRKIGQDFKAVTVSEVRKAFLTLSSITGVTVAVGGVVYITSSSEEWALSFIVSVPLLIISVLVYFFFSSVLTIFIKFLGEKIIRLSELYPSFYFRPKIEYYLKTYHNNEETNIYLYVKSTPSNYDAELTLQFSNIDTVSVNKTNESLRYNIGVASLHFNNKATLYNKKIGKDHLVSVLIGKVVNNELQLLFSDGSSINHLPPERYVYKFNEFGKYRNVNFSSIKRELSITLRKNGEIEL